MRSVHPLIGRRQRRPERVFPTARPTRPYARERPTVTGVRTRPNPVQWFWYAMGGGLPRHLSPWVLADTTRRTWIWRHLARAVVQMLPLVAICLLAVPVPLSYRVSAAVGGLMIGLLFSMAFMTETIEHRARKAGYPPGAAARLRAERAERERVERKSAYRKDGAGSFD
jgi:hypothetical protein